MFDPLLQINESKELQLKLAKKEIHYTSDEVQFFIPLIVTQDCLEWLNIIAEHNLRGENQEIVKEFLSFALELRDANSKELYKTVIGKLMKNFEGL